MSDLHKRVLRWPVPVDDRTHQIGGGRILLVACRNGPREVEVWTEEILDEDWPSTEPRTPPRSVQIIGTGHPHPVEWTVLGSTLAGPLVWHVCEVP